jgi:hypothetical protein
LYKYTPGDAGIDRIFCCRSMIAIEAGIQATADYESGYSHFS